ncbi:MAG: hypothetical protein ACYCZB_03470 [Acidiphilium sp.]
MTAMNENPTHDPPEHGVWQVAHAQHGRRQVCFETSLFILRLFKLCPNGAKTRRGGSEKIALIRGETCCFLLTSSDHMANSESCVRRAIRAAICQEPIGQIEYRTRKGRTVDDRGQDTAEIRAHDRTFGMKTNSGIAAIRETPEHAAGVGSIRSRDAIVFCEDVKLSLLAGLELSTVSPTTPSEGVSS